jgi:hypothetical protein
MNSGITAEKLQTDENNISSTQADIVAIKDGTNIDSFGDVEAALDDKQNTISDLSTIRSGAALGATAVQPETGKGLSSNDFTTAEKTKLGGIAEGAEVNEIDGIKVNNTTINPDANKVVNITVPTTAADVSALPASTKYAAALSLTINSSTFVMTGQLKDQNGDNLGTAQTIDLPLESVVVGGSYNSQTKKVVLTLQNGNTIEFSVADLVSGLQTELSASNKLNPAYINYDSTHRAVSDTEKSTWNNKQNAIDSSHKLSADNVDDTNATNKFATAAQLQQIETNKTNIGNVQTSLAVGSSDNGKVLTASYSGGTGSYAWVTPSGGGSASVVEGYISSDHNKFYSDSAKTIEIAGEANKLYVDRTHATTDGYSLYKWAYNDANSSFVRAGSEVVKGEGTYGIVRNGSSVTSATGYTASPIIGGVPYYKDTTYSLVGTNNTTGLIKNGSTVTSSSGYTASPIINGIPYYKNTTYNNATTSTAGLMSATDKSNLNKTPKVLVRSETSITASTSLADTGVSYTISANKYVRITASARYSSSNPVEIKIGTGSSDFAHTVAQSGDNVSSLTAVAYVGGYSSSTTAKVYAKFSSSGTNYVLLCVEEIPSV